MNINRPRDLRATIVGTLLRNSLIVLVVALVAFLVTSPEGETRIVTRSSEPLVELRESFATVPDGSAPATLVGGSAAVTNYSGPNAAAAPYVRDGFLTTTDPDSAAGGSYRIVELGADVTRVGATFAFTEHTMGGGLLCLSIQDGSLAEDGPVPVSPVHFVIYPGGWEIDANAEAGTGVESVTSGRFAEKLVADGQTLHTVEILLDRAAGTVQLSLPDGSVETLVWPGFNLPGSHVYVEPFKTPGDLGEKTDALVREWWAGSAPVDLPPVALEPVTAVAAPVAPEPEVIIPPRPVQPSVQVPGEPRRIRAVRDGRRTAVTWRRAVFAERYVVRCGSRSRTVSRTTASMRSGAQRCKVRAINPAGVSSWATVRVRSAG